MRITVLRQQLKELITAAPDHDLAKLDDELERVKWYLWHGNVFRALQVLNEDLRPTFERWYPAMTSANVSAARAV